MSTADLTDKQRAFVEEYLVDLNATQAAIRAGYSEATAYSIGHENLGKPHVADAIAAAMAKRSEETGITAEKVLRRWWDIASADPNDLMSFRRANCRHCWGEGFQYQWIDEAEWQRACDGAVNKADESGADLMLPSDDGGFGYKVSRPPHPDCPRCEGTGVGYAHFADTRTVKGPARLLYAGVKQTKEGIEFKVHDQAKALENVARHLGMFVDKSEVEVKGALSDIGDDELNGEILREAKKLGLSLSQIVEALTPPKG